MQREKRMFRKIILPIVSMFAVFSGGVFAVGLGQIKQTSGLNQPLSAQIPLLSAGDLAEYELQASLASNKEFDKVGVDRVFFLNNIKFKTVRDENGQIAIVLSTRTPVKEPFLNFIVELNWPNGRILREYTLLLDPPIFDDSTVSSIEKSTSEPPSSSASQDSQANAESRAPRSRIETKETYESSYSGTTYGAVSSTDTLWSIATKVRPDSSVSIHQTLVAIYRANPDAFGKGNINNLLKGKVLDIPDADTIANVPQRAALQDMVTQNRKWRSGGARKIVDRTGDKNSITRSDSTGSRLSLGNEEQEGSGNAQGYGSDAAELEEVQVQLARTQEESATLQAENEALRARLAEILDKVEQSQNNSAIQVEDAELAALAQESQRDDSNAISDESTKGSQDDQIHQDDQAESSNGEIAETTQAQSEMSKTSDEMVDNQKVADSLADGKTQPEEKTAPAPAIFKSEKKDKGFVDQIMEGGLLLWGSLGGIAIVLFLFFFWRMKKRMEDEDFQDDLVASAGAGSMDTTETFELPDVGDDMLVELDMDDDEGQELKGNTDESFDPLGEADIYIAYGKYEQAESLLLEAVEDNPVRADYKVKLMECYAEMDNREKFEELENEVKDAVDYDEWQEPIAALKAKAWGEDEVVDEAKEEDFDLPSTEDIFGESEDGNDDELDIDFDDALSGIDDLDDDISDEFESSLDTKQEDESLLDDSDFEMDDLDNAQVDDIDELDIEELDIDEENFELDSDETLALDENDDLDNESNADDLLGDEKLDFEELADSEEEEFSFDEQDEPLDGDNNLEGEELILDDDSELSMDTDNDDDISLGIDEDLDFGDNEDMDFEDSMVGDGDEIATKLDLARAYVDMGDSDGAKEILREVVAEGNEEQQAEAQALIDKAD